MNDDFNQSESISASSAESSADSARREALKRLGLLGAYSAPAMMMLFSSRASAQDCVTNPDDPVCALTDSGGTG